MKRNLLMAALAALVGMAFVTGCNAHVHEFEEKWMSDATHHWHKATCEHADVVDGWAEHSFGEWTEGKGICSVCGYEKTCTHTEDGGTVVTPATYVAKGKRSISCTECKAWIRDEDIDMLEPIYVFTEEVKAAPSDYVGTNGTSSTYVVFGDFPQSEAAEGITFRSEPEENGYYVGSDGNYYAKVTVENTRNGYAAGDVKYFKVEPIKWRVVTDKYDYDGSKGEATAKLLFAENILTANIPFYYSEDGTRKVTTEKGTVSGIYPNNYEYSQIRAYLNGLVYYDDSNSAVETYKGAGFLQTAFTESARDLIKTTNVDNSAASTAEASGTFEEATNFACNDTQDKIFLLSQREVTTKDYGFEKYNVYVGDDNGTKSSTRVIMTTAYARANNVSMEAYFGDSGDWWVRSPYRTFSFYSCIERFGGLAYSFSYVDNVTPGIVPALCISF